MPNTTWINTWTMVVTSAVVVLTCAFLPFINGMRTNREMLFGVFIILLSGVSVRRYTLTGALLLAYAAISLYFTKSPSYPAAVEHHIYLITCASVLACAGLYSFRSWAGAKWHICDLVCIIAIVNVLIAVLQKFGIPIPMKTLHNHPVGLMANPNELSSLMAICLPLFFRKKWLPYISVIIFGLLLSQSLQGIIVASVVTVMFIWHKWGRQNALVCMIPAICVTWVFITFVDYNGLHIKGHMDSRGKTWKTTIMVGAEKPILGWGWGQYGVIVPLLTGPAIMGERWTAAAFPRINDMPAFDRALTKVTGTNDINKIKEYLHSKEHNTPAVMLQAHNEYVEAFFTFGILGVLSMAIFIWDTIRRGWVGDILITLSFIATCICAALFFVWQLVPFIALTVLFITMIHGDFKINKEVSNGCK